MSDEIYHSGIQCKYLIQYHIIWCPKFRYPVLSEGRDVRLKEILSDICACYGHIIKAEEVMPDYIHLSLDVPHTVAPCDVVRILKSISAVEMLKDDTDLRKFYSKCGVLWSRGYFISTVEKISEVTVKRYIEEQKHVEENETPEN